MKKSQRTDAWGLLVALAAALALLVVFLAGPAATAQPPDTDKNPHLVRSGVTQLPRDLVVTASRRPRERGRPLLVVGQIRRRAAREQQFDHVGQTAARCPRDGGGAVVVVAR